MDGELGVGDVSRPVVLVVAEDVELGRDERGETSALERFGGVAKDVDQGAVTGSADGDQSAVGFSVNADCRGAHRVSLHHVCITSTHLHVSVVLVARLADSMLDARNESGPGAVRFELRGVHLDPELRAATEARTAADDTTTGEIIRGAPHRFLDVA